MVPARRAVNRVQAVAVTGREAARNRYPGVLEGRGQRALVGADPALVLGDLLAQGR